MQSARHVADLIARPEHQERIRGVGQAVAILGGDERDQDQGREPLTL